jgi:SAM-dependent methyltransferase
MDKEYSVGPLVYDAEMYDGLNTHADDLPFYRYWLKDVIGGKTLELCCGTGRLTIPLRAAGLDITGIDNNELMLGGAKEKAEKQKLDIRFIADDMRSFRLAEKFGAIFIPFNSIHHLYTNRDFFATLQNAKNHLLPGGFFIFDCYNPDLSYIAANEKKAVPVADYLTADNRHIQISQNMVYESDTQINRIKWQYTIDGLFASEESLDMRMYYPQELDSYVEGQGFEIVHKFGDFTQGKFSASSGKQIFVCRV